MAKTRLIDAEALYEAVETMRTEADKLCRLPVSWESTAVANAHVLKKLTTVIELIENQKTAQCGNCRHYVGSEGCDHGTCVLKSRPKNRNKICNKYEAR